MAYLNFSPLEGETRTASASDAGRFSATELRVIDLAERFDAQQEIAPESRIGRFMEWALADRRLESLRRFASLARHHAGEVGENDIRHFVDAGFSTGQAHGLLTYLSQRARRTLH